MKRANKTSTKYQDFDIFSFLEKYDIDFKERGKNIGSGWFALEECPLCGVGGYHFGINRQSKGWHCWGCGQKGHAPILVKYLLNCESKEAWKIVQEFTDGYLEFDIRETGERVILPFGIEEIGEDARYYLQKIRKFNADQIIKQFKLQQTNFRSKLEHAGFVSDFRWRIYIPIFMNKKLVSYTARDYTGQRDPRYQHPFLEACIVPPSSCIYNIDTVSDKCIILEGPTDVWRMGPETVSVQGIETTKEQIRYFAQKGIKKAWVMFDAGKRDKAEKVAIELDNYIPKVKMVNLDYGDPGELTDAEAMKIKYHLFYT